jgi:hypothetical protein
MLLSGYPVEPQFSVHYYGHRSARLPAPTRLHRAFLARWRCQEPGTHRPSGCFAQLRYRLCDHVERQPGLGVTEHRLRRLHVDALGHEPGRIGPSQVVKADALVPFPPRFLVLHHPSHASRYRRGVPASRHPVGVAQQATAGRGENSASLSDAATPFSER